MSFISWLSKIFTGTIERPSPSDIVPFTNISVIGHGFTVAIFPNALNISQPKLVVANLQDTNSMDGMMDYGHNPLLLWADDPYDQRTILDWLWAEPPGNVLVYNIPETQYAIHRIVKKGIDKLGRYYILKGDNNPTSDPWRVREEHIQWLMVGVIY